MSPTRRGTFTKGINFLLVNLSTKKPENIVINAVKGMIPHNRLGRAILSHLKVYSGSEHPHQAQKPMDLTF